MVGLATRGESETDRPALAFRQPVARWMSPLLKPRIRRTARNLWADDLAYARRRYELRQRGELPG